LIEWGRGIGNLTTWFLPLLIRSGGAEAIKNTREKKLKEWLKSES
jgi:hypothetical protein